MIKIVEIKAGVKLSDYNLYSSLAMAIRELNQEANIIMPKLKGRKVWMVNSTEKGGGVAEMMPRLISLFRQLGIESDWVVMSTDKKDFFTVTKKIHNMIHGEKTVYISGLERELYESVNRENAEHLIKLIKPGDIVVINDPQPMALAMYLKQRSNAKFIWRCHIGLDCRNEFTDMAWEFLKPYAEFYKISVFSAAEYIPYYLTGKATVIYPGIDPLDHKNRDLSIHKVVGILCNSNLITEYHPVLTPPFTESVKRLQPNGSFQSPLLPSDIGLLYKPIVLQISRWDRLKGFRPLMGGFVELKKNSIAYSNDSARHMRRLELSQLVLAGPDPDYVKDDPEGCEVLDELKHYYLSLPGSIQTSISILKLPMSSRKYNELIVNSLQRIASIVVQNSIKEGFGLTVTEAMWKIKPVIGTRACGISQQIRDNLDGLLIEDPLNAKEIAYKINYALERPKESEVWGYHGHNRAAEKFLIFNHIRQWMLLFSSL